MFLMEFSMIPLGQGESVSPYVTRVVEVVRKSGLPYELHAMGTIVEGELNELLPLLERCFAELQADCQRITCSVKLDYRQGATDRIHGKVQSVTDKLSS